MKDLVLTILQSVIIAAVPIITGYICTLIKKKTEEAATKIKSAKAAQYMREISDAITTAVSYTSQTYVDSLKSGGAFDAAAQKKALYSARNTAVQILSEDAQHFIEKAYGDLHEYLTTQIEAEVRNQKAGILTAEAITEY